MSALLQYAADHAEGCRLVRADRIRADFFHRIGLESLLTASSSLLC